MSSLLCAGCLLQAVEQKPESRPANSADWRCVWDESERDRQKLPVRTAVFAGWLRLWRKRRRNIPIGQVLRATQMLEPGDTADRRKVLQTAGVRAAVDETFVAWDTPLRDGHTVVFIPPVAGG